MIAAFHRTKIILFLSMFLFLFFSFSSDLSSAAKPIKDSTPPSAPSNLQAGTITDTSVSLLWNASTDNIGVVSYYIYKNGAYIAASASTSYKVTGLSAGQSYSFTVKARDAARNLSASSNILTVKTLLPSVTSTSPSKRLVGYYASWAAYSGYTPDKIDASKLTDINYAFAGIGSDLKIALGDPSVDPQNFTKLSALKTNYPNLKTLISIGGWGGSGKFSDVALTDASRSAFADSCVAFILNYKFDGIDIDWEYPVGGGMSTNTVRPEDKQNFTLLLQKLREKLNAQSAIDNKTYLLTIAGGASSYYVNNTELSTLQQYLDYANIMTYDIHGSWDSYTDFNAPLYNSSDSSPQYKWSVDSSVNVWLNAGFPASKLVMGVPFYGYKYTAVNNANNGLYQKFSGANAVTYSSIASSYLNATGYTRYYHSQSQVPWLFNGSTFISYDDPQSITAKASYVKTKGLGGAMVWELSQDPGEVLLSALYNGLQ